jgi:hypothetical protein
METVTLKVCAARSDTAARIWLEGSRLLAHGFTHKAPFTAEFGKKGLTLRAGTLPTAERVRHVSGSPERPVIDITGELVRKLFGKPGSELKVRFSSGTIEVFKG